MRVVYVTDFYYTADSGAKTSARAHLKTLQNLYGLDNVLVIALVGKTIPNCTEDNHIIYSNQKSDVSMLIQCLQGYTTYISEEIIEEILKDIEKFRCDAVFIDNSIFGKLTHAIKNRFPSIGTVSYYHDVKAGLGIEWLKKDKFYHRPVFTAMLKNERWNQESCDVNLVLNERENKVYRNAYGKSAEGFLSVYMDIPLTDYVDKNLESPLKLLFVGGSYLPNIHGISWFIDNVLPKLQIPVVLSIVGNNMEKHITKEIVPDNVNVLGRVDDLNSVYTDADVVVEPIFEGAGMKVKTAEALAYGKVVIASDESLVGYIENIPETLIKDVIYRANTASEFKEAIEQVYEKRNFLRKDNLSVRQIYESFYSEQYAERVISAAIEEAINKKGSVTL